MLNAERASVYWGGDLRAFATRTWCEDADVVAVAIASDGQARAWLNPRFINSELSWLIWLRLRRAMVSRPFAVLYAADLAPLLPDGGQQAAEA